MRTHLSVEYEHRDSLPDWYSDEVRTPDALAERCIAEFSDPGDRVVDPFAGFGTTLAAAERLDRVPYGLEFEPERVEYVRERIDHPEHVRQGDVLDLPADRFPECELCFTSPPFMTEGMERNPFENYAGETTYAAYLEDVEAAFEQLRAAIAPGGRVVIDVANMKHEGTVTTLAWDVADAVAETFAFEGERVVAWEGGDHDRDGEFGYGYDHTYCLVFENAE